MNLCLKKKQSYEEKVDKLIEKNPITLEELEKYCNSEISADFVYKLYIKYNNDPAKLYSSLVQQLDRNPNLQNYTNFVNLIKKLKELL